MMKVWVVNSATVVLTACTVLITGVVVRREFRSREASGSTSSYHEVDNWSQLSRTGQLLGSPDAKVRIVEFGDFQCPACAAAVPLLDDIRRMHGDDVAVVYRHFPLQAIHPHAVEAAILAECAAVQGRFEAIHNTLFARQDSIGVADWLSFGAAAGVPDLAELDGCMRSERFRDRVTEDASAATRLGVLGTPTFVIAGRMVTGVPAKALLVEWIEEAMK